MLSLRSLVGLAFLQVLASATPTPQAATSNGTAIGTQSFQGPALCGNGGLEWAAWPSTARHYDTLFREFQPARAFKKTPPDVAGRIPYAGGIFVINDQKNIDIYNSGYIHPAGLFSISHRGYIYGVEAGTYTVRLRKIDNTLFFWAGPLAYAGWRRGNQAFKAIIHVKNTGSYNIKVGANEFVPIRFIFGAGSGPTRFSIQITSPSGVVVLNDTTRASNYIVTHSCDLKTAPRFDPWGSES
ncbi:GLEYA domain-containing protein [Microdochium nivale]|nr:GLEYA domain-containing protein [Microdochium nivale]